MAEIFISYKSDRRNAAKHLAGVLARHGYSVWYDYGLIKGDDFDFQLDRQLRDAKAVIVLWCTMSVESTWVSREASLAARLKTLLPVLIEDCELKLAHTSADYVDLRQWDGSPRGYVLDPLLREITRLVKRAPNVDWEKLSEYEAEWQMFGAPTLAAFALGRPVEPPSPSANESLMTIAAREWPMARDSRDVETLQSFELHFPGTYFADQARTLRRTLEIAQKIEALRSEELKQFVRDEALPSLEEGPQPPVDIRSHLGNTMPDRNEGPPEQANETSRAMPRNTGKQPPG